MSLGQEFEESFAQVIHFIPEVLGALVILIVGFVVAKLLEKGTDLVLERVQFDRALARGGISAALERTGTRLDPSSVVAKLVFWMVMLVAVLMAANALGLTTVAEMFENLVGYIPHVIVAVLIVSFGMLIGEFVKDLIAASMGMGQGGIILSRTAKAIIVTLAIFMALDQLQVARSIVVTAFTILLGAVGFGAALAFGLGNRELAGELTRQWVDSMRNALPGRPQPRVLRQGGERRRDIP